LLWEKELLRIERVDLLINMLDDRFLNHLGNDFLKLLEVCVTAETGFILLALRSIILEKRFTHFCKKY